MARTLKLKPYERPEFRLPAIAILGSLLVLALIASGIPGGWAVAIYFTVGMAELTWTVRRIVRRNRRLGPPLEWID